MKLLIIADDFTGALDTGVQLSKKEISTCVYVDCEHIPNKLPDSEVIVINANMRHMSPKAAYDTVKEILQKLYSPEIYLYIKTDSVLRGNISAAFAAAIDFVKKPLFFIPAFPDLSRTTRNATAYVNGSLLENSVFANDPRTPTTSSDIPSIINKEYSIQVNCINSDKYGSIKQNKEALEAKSVSFDSTNESDYNCVYLFDCENNKQLKEIGNILSETDNYKFTAGCAGFASTFCEHIIFKNNSIIINKKKEPSLFISGSANAITFAQLQYAKECNYTTLSLSNALYSYIKDSTENMDFKELNKNLPFQNMVDEACTKLHNNNSIIFATATKKQELLDIDSLHKLGKNDEQIHNCIAEYTSNLVKSIVDATSLSNIVVFGGDMVAAILKKLGIFEVLAAGEITAGVPLCQIRYKDRIIYLVTKSGGFGNEDLIPIIEKYFMKG